MKRKKEKTKEEKYTRRLEEKVFLKIIYWGMGGSGKTTILKTLYRLTKETKRDIVPAANLTLNTHYFDRGNFQSTKQDKVYYHVYTVAGQHRFSPLRKKIFKGTDGVIFVVDSQTKFFEDNISSLLELKRLAGDRLIKEIPLIILLNKQDLKDVIDEDDIIHLLKREKLWYEANEKLSLWNPPIYKTCALFENQKGIYHSFQECARMCLDKPPQPPYDVKPAVQAQRKIPKEKEEPPLKGTEIENLESDKVKKLIKLYEENRREEKEVELENLKEVKKKRARENKIPESERVWKVLHPRLPPPYSSEINESKSINTICGELKIIKKETRCNVCFKRIPRGKTPLTKTTCPSCASSLESGFWKGITMGLPLEEHGIERWHLHEIWEHSEIEDIYLLKALVDAGDPIARRVFKNEVAERFGSGDPNTIISLVNANLLDYFSLEEKRELILPNVPVILKISPHLFENGFVSSDDPLFEEVKEGLVRSLRELGELGPGVSRKLKLEESKKIEEGRKEVEVEVEYGILKRGLKRHLNDKENEEIKSTIETYIRGLVFKKILQIGVYPPDLHQIEKRIRNDSLIPDSIPIFFKEEIKQKTERSYYDILFVEGGDYPVTITLPMAYFGSKGYSCQGVFGGKKGFEELSNNIPKVIFLDIMLPDFSGYEICKQIKSNPKWKDIPVFFFTGIPGSEVAKHLAETKADGYILKPFDFSDFDGILDLLGKKKRSIRY